MRITLLLMLTTVLTTHAARADEGPKPSAELSSLQWMSGHWISHAGERITEEVWMSPAGSVMTGMNRTVRNDGRTAFEFLRITATENGLVYIASPGGSPGTEFPLKEAGRHTVTFENPTHDFPQRIIYTRRDNTLTGRIEGVINGQPRQAEWQWQLAAPSPSLDRKPR